MDDLKEVLKKLSQVPGVAGHEGEVAQLMASLFGGLAEVRRDSLGNVIAFKKGNWTENPFRVMLAAHMDEIGFLVSGLEKGFLRVSPLGGFDFRTLVNQEVLIHGRRELPGVFNAFSPHLTSPKDREKGVKPEELFVDAGLTEEELGEAVRVGDRVSIRGDFMSLDGDAVAGKAMDDRAGLAVLYGCLKELKGIPHGPDVYAVATVKEEIGFRGAMVSAYGIQPQVGIAVDVTHGDLPGVPKHETFPLGKGPAIGWGPNIHPALYRKLKETATEYGIPWHKELIPGSSGTDAMAIQIAREGVATGVLSIPLRYMHTSVETLDLGDIKKAARLLAFFIKDLEDSFQEVLTCF